MSVFVRPGAWPLLLYRKDNKHRRVADYEVSSIAAFLVILTLQVYMLSAALMYLSSVSVLYLRIEYRSGGSAYLVVQF